MEIDVRVVDVDIIEHKIRLASDRLNAASMSLRDWDSSDVASFEYRQRDYDQALGRYQGLIDLAEHVGLH